MDRHMTELVPLEFEKAARRLRKRELVHLVAWVLNRPNIRGQIEASVRIQQREGLLCHDCNSLKEKLC